MLLSNKKIILILISFSILTKLLYLTVPPIVYSEFRDAEAYDIYLKYTKNNDSWWYQKIIDNGYEEVNCERDLGYCEWPDFKQSSWAFFPMYPLIIKGIKSITGLSSDICSTIASIILSTLAMFAIFWFGFIYYKDKSKALFTTILIFTFPFHFYFSAFYTEALFLSLLVFSFIAIKTHRYTLLSLLLIPLVLTRPNGLVAIFPLYLYFLECNNLLEKYKLKFAGLFTTRNILQSLFFISGVIAFGTYCYYQYTQTGFYNAFSIAQRGWEKEYTFPLASLFSNGKFESQFHSSYALAFMLFSIYAWRKLPISMNILIWAGILLPLSAGSTISMARYISILFPLFFVLGDLIYKLKIKYIILAMLFIGQLFTLAGFIQGAPICY